MSSDSNLPVVSIVIPIHNCLDLTKVCVDSIRRHTQLPYELILIDDASDHDTAHWLKQQEEAPDVTLIRNDHRKNYSANNNAGAALAQGTYLCLLNNDTWVTPGWLDHLVDFAEQHEQAGVIGNKHLFPDSHTIHHCGMAVTPQGHPEHLYPGIAADDPKANFPRALQLVTFACVLIRTEIYTVLQGLDESFINGYEDCDFCLRALQQGHQIWYTPSSVIYHYGQATPGRKQHDRNNYRQFLEKWDRELERDWHQRKQEAESYADRHQTRRARHATSTGFHFAIDFSAGSAFTWATAELIHQLIEKGEEVSIEPTRTLNGAIEGPIRKQLRAAARRSPRNGCHVKWSHYWNAFLRKPLSGDVNVEFFCTNYRQHPNTPLDLWLRHVEASRNYLLPIGVFNQQALEDIGISKSRMAVMPLGYSPEIDRLYPDGLASTHTRSDLHLFVITNSHDLERYGTDLLVKACAQAYGPDDPVILHIKDYGIGSGSDRLQKWIAAQPRFPRVVWHRDFLSREDLIRLYAEMDILIAPFRGEGFGMKVIDAMALGMPVMMPAFGGPMEFAHTDMYLPIQHHEVPVGPCYDRAHHVLSDAAYWCEVDLDNFVHQLQRLPYQREALHAIGRRARTHVRSHYSWSAVADHFIDATAQWKSQRDHRVLLQQTPSACECTVIIPTKDRIEILDKTLAQYARQDVEKSRWELLLVNDGGEPQPLDRLTATYRNQLPLSVINNQQAPGPAGARNTAMQQAKGHIVLITGDDIIPDSQLISAHMSMHKQHPEIETAVLGKTLWSPDLDVTPFMDYLTGEGGHQFAYADLQHGALAPYDRFYTSNISIKRSFLSEEDGGFHTGFRYAAYEDIELAYRLYLRGMRIRYNQNANGYHHHMMTPASFAERQRKVGRMLTYLYFVQPSYVPPEHARFLNALEAMRTDPELMKELEQDGASTASHLQSLLNLFNQQLAIGRFTPREDSAGANTMLAPYRNWLGGTAGSSWEAINELILRVGMAEEWAMQQSGLTAAAKQWVTLMTLPSLFQSHTAARPQTTMMQAAGYSAMQVHLHRVYQLLFNHALTRKALIRAQQSRWYVVLRQRLMQ
jgi:GT2 family glycosyltransferase